MPFCSAGRPPCFCKALKTIEEEARWASHEEWLFALAALSTIHSTVQRPLGKRKAKLRRVSELAGIRQEHSLAIFTPEAYVWQ